MSYYLELSALMTVIGEAHTLEIRHIKQRGQSFGTTGKWGARITPNL